MVIIFIYHFSASYVFLPFWWKLPNLSTELPPTTLFFFFFLGTEGKIFISNNFNEETVISTPCLHVRVHHVSYICMKGAVFSLCSHLRCREDTLN